MAIETTVVPGVPPSWREFDNADFDPQAAVGGDEDLLGELIAERTREDPFGIALLADPVEAVDQGLIKRLAALMIPTKVCRGGRDEHKVGEKKKAKK
jgi:hypothetical protein